MNRPFAKLFELQHGGQVLVVINQNQLEPGRYIVTEMTNIDTVDAKLHFYYDGLEGAEKHLSDYSTMTAESFFIEMRMALDSHTRKNNVGDTDFTQN